MITMQRRQSVRLDSIAIPARVGDGRTMLACSIHDFSRGGCRIAADGVERLADTVTVMIGGIDEPMPGRIAWRRKGVIGIEFQWGTPRPADARREVRKTVAIAARAWDQRRRVSVDCTILDASPNGCQIEADELALLPDQIVLDVPSLQASIPGDVRWRADGRAGVQFAWQAVARLGNDPTPESDDKFYID